MVKWIQNLATHAEWLLMQLVKPDSESSTAQVVSMLPVAQCVL
jgi:hypothetical protein